MTRGVDDALTVTPDPRLRCVIYCRVSTDEQAAADKTSIDTQETRCREYARLKGWEVVDVFYEDFTGFELSRPELDKVRRNMQQGMYDVLLCLKVDRLTRNHLNGNIILLEAREHNVLLDFSDDQIDLNSEAGPLVLQMYLYFAEKERNTIVKRLVDGKTGMLNRKVPVLNGPAPYGYIRVKTDEFRGFRKDPETAATVDRMWQMVMKGESYHAIARYLNANGIPTNKGREWSASVVRRLFQHPAYKGWTVARRTGGASHIRNVDEWVVLDTTGTITPAYVTEREWSTVATRTKNASSDHTRNKHHFHLLRGIAYCQRCGSRLYITNDGKYQYYVCGTRWQSYQQKNIASETTTCDLPYIPATVLEQSVWDKVLTLLTTRESEIRLYLESDAVRGPDALLNSERQQIVKQLETTEKRIKRVLSRIQDEDDDELYKELRGQWTELKHEREVLDERLALIDEQLRQQADANERVDRFVDLLSLVNDNLTTDDLTEEDQIDALTALGVRVEVFDREHSSLKIYDRDADSFTSVVAQDCQVLPHNYKLQPFLVIPIALTA